MTIRLVPQSLAACQPPGATASQLEESLVRNGVTGVIDWGGPSCTSPGLPPSSRTKDPDVQKGDLWYSLTNAPNALLIRPDSKRLMSLWKGGGEIQLLQGEQYKNFDNFGVVSKVAGLRNRAESASRLRQWGMALGSYVSENNGDLPRRGQGGKRGRRLRRVGIRAPREGD